ncbi:MAG TPA: response regulator [Clostridia bacterium]|nr:response regulator [Clostridia bacterium]
MTQHDEEVTILIAEDDDGHASLISLALEEAGLRNPIHRFRDGRETLDFLFQRGTGSKREDDRFYLLLLDIRMPLMDGVQVLKTIKQDAALRNLPVIMLTTTDDPHEIQTCYDLGCNCYITKPVEFHAFSDSLKRVGLFLKVVRVPQINSPVEDK